MKRYIAAALIVMTAGFAKADSLESLLQTVERNNLTLKEMREEMKAQGYEIKEQNRLDNTSVEYSPFYRKGAEGIASSELIVTQEFDFPTLYAVRGKAGKGRMSVMERQYAVAIREVLLDATENYLGLVRLQKIRATLEEQLKNAEMLSGAYKKRADLGDATAVEVNRIRLQVMQLRNDLKQNEGEMTTIEARLRELNGYEAYDVNSLHYPSWGQPSADLYRVEGDAEVLLANSEVESSRLDEKVAKQQWLPKLTLGYRRNTELEEASHGFVVGASFPFFTASSKVNAAKARRVAAEIAADNARRKVAAETVAALQELEIIRQSMAIYDKNLIEETERLLGRSLELGQITVADYYSELEVLNERRMDYIELEYAYYQKMCVLYKNQLSRN